MYLLVLFVEYISNRYNSLSSFDKIRTGSSVKKHLASKSCDSIQFADWSNYFVSDQFHSNNVLSKGDTTKITPNVIEKRGYPKSVCMKSAQAVRGFKDKAK